MSTIFRKNLNLKNIRLLKIVFRTIDHELRIFRPNIRLINSVSHHHRFATAVLPQYGHNEIKDNEAESLNVTLQNVDKAFLELDDAVQSTGRCSKINVQNILSKIEKLHSASEIHGLYLLRCCGLMYMEKPGERVRLANEIWERLQNLDVHLDIKHYNSLLKVFVECNHQFSPSEFLALMEGSRIEPNKATYLLLLQKYCNDGNLSGAGEILQCLKEKGLPINESVFTLLIKGHMRANDVSGAQDILEVMRSADLSPTAESYATLSCGFAERGDEDGLNSVLAKAKDNNIVLTNQHYLDIISSWSDAENITVINELLEKIADVDAWRQEIANAMMDSVYKGRDAVAFKLLLRIANLENNFACIFSRLLLKCDTPKEKIVSYCEEISDRGLHKRIFINTAKAAVNLGKFEITLALLEALQNKGFHVRSQNFHLLLSSFKDQEEGIWLTLKKMFDLGVPLEFITLLEYVYPAISVSNPEAVLSKIQETGYSFTVAIDSLFQFYCFRGEFDNALYLIEKYPVNVHRSFLLENYINACKDINNFSKACLKVLKYLLQNIGAPYVHEPEAAEGIHLATLIQKNHLLFEALVRTPDKEIQLNEKSIDICCTVLRRNNPDSLRYLRRLGIFRNQSKERGILRSMKEEEEELKFLKKNGLPTERYLLDCLSSHLKERNIMRINQLIDELDKQGARYPPTVRTQMLHFFCQNNNLEEAEKYFKILKSDCPTYKLDSLKVIEYATLLIKYSKFDDAVNVIKEECQELYLGNVPDALFKKGVRNLLNIAVETGNYDLVKCLQESLSFHIETLQANVLHEPLVKICLYKNDLDTAINEFEICVEKHRAVPCLKMLMKKCIMAENPTKLQIVIKIASTVVGQQFVLYNLVVALLETGRRSEANKIMENLKDKSDSSLEDICSQMYNQNKFFDIVELVKLLWAVNHVDREKITHYILKLSSERNDLKTAQDLYNSISKSFELSDEIKETFSNLQSNSGRPVAFASSESNVSAFLQCLLVKDAHLALKTLQQMKKGVVRTLEFSDMTNFIDLLLKNKILSGLSQNVNAVSYVIENAKEILKPLLEKYSSLGDIDSLVQIANFFPDFTLKKCSVSKYLSKGFISSEKHEDLLLELEKRCDKKVTLFSISAFEELLKRPDLEERVINLAKKYLESNFDLPMAVVWAHYLIQDRSEEAEVLFKSYSLPVDKVDNLVLRTVRQQENVTLGMAYLSILKNIDTQKRHEERLYGTILDVLVLKEMYDDAAALVTEAKERDVNVEKDYRSTLITLKNALEREKKNVPFSILTEAHVTSE